MSCSAVFLDRGGVMNIHHDYVPKPENFDFVEGFDVAQYARALGYKLVGITNQAGIGRGYYGEADFPLITHWMCQKSMQAGAPTSHVYFSPYHPTAGLATYLKDDFSRKPNPGLIFQAREELDLGLSGSIWIRDQPSDIEAGIAASISISLPFAEDSPMGLEVVSYQKIVALRYAYPDLIRLSHARGAQ